MLNQRFCNYFYEKFFDGKDEEFSDFLSNIEKPILRTIRIKPGKENLVKKNLESDGWKLIPTDVPRVFVADREENFNPFERRLGMSIDHLIGNFYIQELAASHPVNLLADWKIHDEKFLILDMASSPGGKTTQLSENFPNSFIIANEPSRERIPQLLQNLERMHTPNTAVTLYPGQQWRHFGEIFDRILLDAPCSGEWTLYKWTDAVKNWHIKSIKQIANLQKKLIQSALIALKTGGEMVYSTCALNDLENEWILEFIKEKYGNKIEIIFQKKFWPHIDKTGWFFMAKIIKKAPISENIEIQAKNYNDEIKNFRKNLGNFETKDWISLFSHRDKILAVKNTELVEKFLDKMYFMRFGETIWYLENNKFEPNARAYRDLEVWNFEEIFLNSDEEIDYYLRWWMIETENDWYFLIKNKENIVSLEKSENNLIENNFPKDWRRK